MSNNNATTRSPSRSGSNISSKPNHPHPQQESSKKAKRNTTGKHTSSEGTSHDVFPYETNYNDHFETPVRAFQDVSILLDWVMMQQTKKSSTLMQQKQDQVDTLRQDVILYDPYYCNGRSKRILQEQLGYRHVVHEKRDFYHDIDQDTVPVHHVFITNPPYSDENKSQCLAFCFQKWQQNNATSSNSGPIPFFILMPAYVATRKYFRDLMQQYEDDTKKDNSGDLSIVYLLPSRTDGPYEYDHPEGTGKDEAPFDSVWFCSIQKHQIPALRDYWNKQVKEQSQTTDRSSCSMPRLAFSVQELADMRVIAPLEERRPNPKQRKKRRRMQLAAAAAEAAAALAAAVTIRNGKDGKRDDSSSLSSDEHAHNGGGKRSKSSTKQSKYRGNDGKRIKRRF